MEVRLTDKQKRFAEEYLADLNATQAAIRAGYGKKSASSVGSEMLNNPDISQYVAYLKYERSKKVECTSEMVLKELMKIGFSNIYLAQILKQVFCVETFTRGAARISNSILDEHITKSISKIIDFGILNGCQNGA